MFCCIGLIYVLKGDHRLMSVDTITYDNFVGDPFINEVNTDNETKGTYHIIKWAYQTYGDTTAVSYTHL